MNHKWWRSSSQWLFPHDARSLMMLPIGGSPVVRSTSQNQTERQKKKGHPTVPMLTESWSDGQQGPKTRRGVHLGEVLSTNSPSPPAFPHQRDVGFTFFTWLFLGHFGLFIGLHFDLLGFGPFITWGLFFSFSKKKRKHYFVF
jgi:hypothetical protein